ncbi:hypothetical protein [Histidinibacterium aquaticum]|uniref:Uncharacterized protein n=1 Tax=Histidinibacterium aquaticum TaxID=2613962 RepID=A0A5J5GLY8_9RHOB|nr:hypothetical protein [Histidinibacterium aquaticum]KAA9009301.1 hypothetical protein F3S47_08630 [Histidinibacterium aquaticum]
MAAPQEADLLLVPLLDGSRALVQVAGLERGTMNLALTLARATEPRPVRAEEIIALLLCSERPVREGHWPVIGYERIPRLPPLAAHSTPQDPGVIEAFLNACHGLYPWDGFPQPDFFTGLLAPGIGIPDTRRMAAEFPQGGQDSPTV